MKWILIVTDAWHSLVSGVVCTMYNVIGHLRARQFELRKITPDMFFNLPQPVQLSLFGACKYAEKYSWNACSDQFLQKLVRAS